LDPLSLCITLFTIFLGSLQKPGISIDENEKRHKY